MKRQHTLPLASLERLESICVRFEYPQTEADKNIEQLIAGIEEPDRTHFIHELVALDLELRRQNGETPVRADYVSFSNPTDAKIANEAYLSHGSDGAGNPSTRKIRASESLPNRYLPIKEVGRGGIGCVWQVEDQYTHRTLAIKFLRDKFKRIRQLNIRLDREALLTGSLQHPGIPPVHDFGKLTDGSSYFVMKLIEGKNLG